MHNEQESESPYHLSYCDRRSTQRRIQWILERTTSPFNRDARIVEFTIFCCIPRLPPHSHSSIASRLSRRYPVSSPSYYGSYRSTTSQSVMPMCNDAGMPASAARSEPTLSISSLFYLTAAILGGSMHSGPGKMRVMPPINVPARMCPAT